MNLARFASDVSVDEAWSVLDRDGAVVIERLASSALMAEVEKELSPWLDGPVEQSPLGNNFFTGFKTLRTSGLIAKSRGCGDLATNPLVLHLADRVLGPQCSRFQLSFTQAIKIGPGERAQAVHRDSTMYPFRRPGPEVFLNVLWALTDFTADNGATRLYLGSHHWPEGRAPRGDDEVAVAAMPRGSALVYYGSCFHGGGSNSTTASFRIGIGLGYALGWLRQEENQYLAVPPERAKTLPVDLQRLIGYAEHYPFLGWYEGEDEELFRGGSFRKNYRTEVEGGDSKPLSQILALRLPEEKIG